MRAVLRYLVPKSIRSYIYDIQYRIANLEMIIDVMLNSPVYVPGNDVGFNGQLVRKQIFQDLIRAFPFEVILETGTWTGNTSAYMAQVAGLPVHTCEMNARFHTVAKQRLKEVNSVDFSLADSRRFLEHLAETDAANKFAFIYLDAHWYDDLPLQQEVAIIEKAWKKFVVMIDDFRVPGDDGYGFDSYERKPLELGMLGESMKLRKLAAFYPASPSSQETGNKRGCVVITRQGEFAEQMATISSLRSA